MMFRRWLFIYVVVTAFCFSAKGQRFPFTQFDTDRGLAQSQVQDIAQDQQKHLWIATFNGVDRFDGKTFTHFSKADGLLSNTISCLTTAKDGKVWIATLNGVAVYDGYRITACPIAIAAKEFLFTEIAEDREGHIYALDIRKGLFKWNNQQFTQVPSPVGKVPISAMTLDKDRQLIVNVHNTGIYTRNNEQWSLYCTADTMKKGEFIFRMVSDAQHTLYTMTNKGMLAAKYHKASKWLTTTLPVNNSKSLCLLNDSTIWVGTDKGIFAFDRQLSLQQVYDDHTGLTNNSITTIYSDADGNAWVGSDGDGFFRYTPSQFTHYDKRHGLPGNIVMGFGKDKQHNVYLAIREGGLMRYSGQDKTLLPVDYSRFSTYGFNCSASDAAGQLWLGTLDGKLLRYNGHSFTPITFTTRPPIVNAIYFDDSGTGWVATTAGCYYVNNDTAHAIPGFNQLATSITQKDAHTMLICSSNGVYNLYDRTRVEKIKTILPENIDANCIIRYGQYLLVGTMDNGIYCWDTHTDKAFSCTTREGLADNQVYSLYADSQGRLWCGSGRGIQEIVIQAGKCTVKNNTAADGYLNAENNLNAILEDQDGRIWFGTTRGAFVYGNSLPVHTNSQPYVIIKNVSSDGRPADSTWYSGLSAWNHLPESLRLPYGQQDIGFEFLGINLKDPESVSYSYQLEGQDTGFSPLTHQSLIRYRNLEPGNYIFHVKAFTADGTPSSNTASFAFSIRTPFVKTLAFRLLLLLLLLLAGVGIQRYLTSRKAKKRKELERIRKEEQSVIRQKTAEDFHDEMGNKLTRITVLADILEKKMGNSDEQQAKLVQQIKDNAGQLYSGTRDILWTLDPGNDNLYETGRRIRETGNELFQYTNIRFECAEPPPAYRDISFPIDYSRNLIMVLKEGMTNVLKHAGATLVVLTVEQAADRVLIFSLADNGHGFDTDAVQKGKGLHNIRNRAKRIHAGLTITSAPTGTTLLLRVKCP